MDISLTHMAFLSLFHLSAFVSTFYLPVRLVCVGLYFFLSNFLSGRESDALWLSLSCSGSLTGLTKSLELMETRCLTPSFPEASQNYSARFICALRKSLAHVMHQANRFNAHSGSKEKMCKPQWSCEWSSWWKTST